MRKVIEIRRDNGIGLGPRQEIRTVLVARGNET
jgi:hypothetical protein